MEHIFSPLSEALTAVVGDKPPVNLDGVHCITEISDDDFTALQNWCADNAKPEWATGMSMIEAAVGIVTDAVENANIQGKGEEL